jgi:hypothetical protein
VTTDDTKYVLSLIREGEHLQQDFKYRVADAVKLARSVSAFANTCGGRLLIGVRDDGHISGVRSEEEIYMMHQAAYRYCRPEASIKFETFHAAPTGVGAGGRPLAGSGLRTVVVATVPQSDRRPVCAIGDDGVRRAYIRIADENIVATPVHIAIWREQQRPQGTMFTYGDNERQLLASMQHGSGMTLNQIVRRSRLPRHVVVAVLARMVRYGLAACQFTEHQFLWALEK